MDISVVSAVSGIVNSVGLVAVIGAVVWLIRLEGKVKQNSEKIHRLSGIEQQTADQEVRIGKRDEEMKALKHSLDDLKERMEKMENKQLDTVAQLSRMEAKLDILLEEKGK